MKARSRFLRTQTNRYEENERRHIIIYNGKKNRKRRSESYSALARNLSKDLLQSGVVVVMDIWFGDSSTLLSKFLLKNEENHHMRAHSQQIKNSLVSPWLEPYPMYEACSRIVPLLSLNTNDEQLKFAAITASICILLYSKGFSRRRDSDCS